jgi:hypothetical protein
MPRGPKPTTGRYETRAELEEAVRRLYWHGPQNVTQVARACRISLGTALKILNKPGPPQRGAGEPTL